MRCAACGAENPAGNRFCGQCGARLGEAAEERAAQRGEAATAAERRQLTVMFCDLIGSTELSGRLDPEELQEIMLAYRETSLGEVERFGGSLAKYLGDGVLAYFGYPAAHDDDAVRAVSAGLAITAAMPGLEQRLGTRLGVSLRCRIGIATGPVVVGEIGSGVSRESMAAVGETPNLAARLQELAPPNGVVIAALTRQLIGPRFRVEPLGPRALKGVARALEVFLVAGQMRRVPLAARLPLIGRVAEFSVLDSAYHRARQGEVRAVAVVGEPGIGKSRLIKELKRKALSERGLWLEAQCAPYYTDTPLHPAQELLSRAIGVRQELVAAARLGRLGAFLGRLGLPSEPHAALLGAMLSLPLDGHYRLPALSPQALKARTFDCVIVALTRLAARRPIVLAIEDLHWADASTLELIDVLLTTPSAAPLLLLKTFRPEFNRAWPAGIPLEVIRLQRLSSEASTGLIGQVAGKRVLPETVVNEILARSDGVPLFMVEITRALIGERDGQGAAEAPAGEAYDIPATLRDSLMARLDRLPTAREVAQIGAAIGRSFLYELLVEVSGLDEPALHSALTALEGAELIQARGVPPAAIYTFRHALIREIAYDSLLRRRRQELHAAIGDALERRFPEIAEGQPELLARHFVAAGEGGRAIEYCERAGRRAAARSAHVEAIRHFERGIGLLEEQPASIDRLRREADFWSGRATSLLVSRGYGSIEVGEAYQRANALGRRLGDPLRQFHSGWGITAYRFVTGDLTGTLEMLDELERTACDASDETLRAIVLMSRSVALFALGRFADSVQQADRGLAI
jgi:class 3 adenylate cyclase